jgi:hypothetical protein
MTETARTHRVNSAFPAVSNADNAFLSVTLEPGDTIVVHSGRTSVRSGLVEVLYDGIVLSAYLRDIEDRTECVGSQAEGS